MPRGDGTGPLGFGPMTGRGAGYCAGYAVPGFANPWGGMGRRMGRGRGTGFRFRYAPTVVPVQPMGGMPGMYAPPVEPGADELISLKAQAGVLERTLAELSKRIEALEKERPEEVETE